MDRPEKSDFPRWMFEDPWETVLSFLLDARQTAVQIKLAVHSLKMEPSFAKTRIESIGMDKPQTAEQLAERIDSYTDALLDTIDSLSEFRSIVKHQTKPDV